MYIREISISVVDCLIYNYMINYIDTFSSSSPDGNVNFAELDIPVNAAATALKDYLKQLPPLLPQSQLMELTTIASE